MLFCNYRTPCPLFSSVLTIVFFRHGKLDEILKGEYSGYRLRVCGHSLGAACATILSLFLRPRYPKVRCLAFSPPGCVLSKDLAEECSRWQTSYVLDADIVPRLSIESFEDLRDELLETVCRIKIPKYQISHPTRQENRTRASLVEANANVLCDPAEPHDSSFKRQVEEFRELQANLKAQQQSALWVPLYPPGEIIQLFRTWDKSSLRRLASDETSGKPLEHTARWIERDDLDKIILSSHLLFDHDPVQVKRKLQKIAGGFGLDPPYTSVLRSTSA
jgi:sn1-specific diacylglycerol lipase